MSLPTNNNARMKALWLSKLANSLIQSPCSLTQSEEVIDLRAHESCENRGNHLTRSSACHQSSTTIDCNNASGYT
jgi:hypothetical protein